MLLLQPAGKQASSVGNTFSRANLMICYTFLIREYSKGSDSRSVQGFVVCKHNAAAHCVFLTVLDKCEKFFFRQSRGSSIVFASHGVVHQESSLLYISISLAIH